MEVGGLRGVELDVAIAAGWAASCPFAEGIPTVPLIVGPNPDESFRWVVAGSERLRISILDVPGGGTVKVTQPRTAEHPRFAAGDAVGLQLRRGSPASVFAA